MMRGKNKWMVVCVFAVVLLGEVPSVRASVILNEIFADPASGLNGDANDDGTRSGTQDEFIELLNNGAGEMDISGWSLWDNVSARHVFPASTVMGPYTFLAVFGGGAPSLPGINWQVASSGSLGLNNSSDTVTLFDVQAQVIDQVAYGSIASKDQSITLFPDGEGTEFFLHSGLEGAEEALFSPGTSITSELSLYLPPDQGGEEPPFESAAVPELPALVYFAMGWGSLFLKRK